MTTKILVKMMKSFRMMIRTQRVWKMTSQRPCLIWAKKPNCSMSFALKIGARLFVTLCLQPNPKSLNRYGQQRRDVWITQMCLSALFADLLVPWNYRLCLNYSISASPSKWWTGTQLWFTLALIWASADWLEALMLVTLVSLKSLLTCSSVKIVWTGLWAYLLQKEIKTRKKPKHQWM